MVADTQGEAVADSQGEAAEAFAEEAAAVGENAGGIEVLALGGCQLCFIWGGNRPEREPG